MTLEGSDSQVPETQDVHVSEEHAMLTLTIQGVCVCVRERERKTPFSSKSIPVFFSSPTLSHHVLGGMDRISKTSSWNGVYSLRCKKKTRAEYLSDDTKANLRLKRKQSKNTNKIRCYNESQRQLQALSTVARN